MKISREHPNARDRVFVTGHGASRQVLSLLALNTARYRDAAETDKLVRTVRARSESIVLRSAACFR